MRSQNNAILISSNTLIADNPLLTCRVNGLKKHSPTRIILDKNLFQSLDIQSKGFSIEVETMAKLVLKGLIIEEVIIRYNRRTLEEGKKLKISDSWNIIWMMFIIKFFQN